MKQQPTMTKATILMADNHKEYLTSTKKLLEKEGYRVVTANNVEQARDILNKGQVDLAVLDIHMRDDEDKNDESGLELAQETSRTIPKVMLTKKPTLKKIKKAYESPYWDLPPAVGFVSKSEGFTKLLNAVRKALKPKVFIAHGHDKHTRDKVARFVEMLGLTPVILQDHPGGGRAIIEKFEDYSNVNFAIVILTPDDIGGAKNVKPKVGGLKVPKPELKPRARQNVIFELGFFMGAIGRGNVAVLYLEDVELPSNYLGVEYILMKDDTNDWKEQLGKELYKAGIKVNLNKIANL